MSAFAIAVLGLIFYFIYRRIQYVRLVNRIPSFFPTITLGVLGHIGWLVSLRNKGEDATSFTMRMMDCMRFVMPTSRNSPYGLSLMWLGPLPQVSVFTPEAAEVILSSNSNLRKSEIYYLLDEWLGTGLLTSWGTKWKSRRRLLTPAFHFQILEQFVPIMNETAKTLIQVLRREAGQDGVVEDLRKFILRTALDVICETAMGEKINALTSPSEGRYIKAVDAVGRSIVERLYKPWLHNNTIFGLTPGGRETRRQLKILHDFTDSVIKSRKADILSRTQNDLDRNSNSEFTTKRKEPFMDTLIREHLKNPQEMTERDIREEVDTFMFEGQDSTAWGMIWTIFLLGHHPSIQKKLQEEVDQVFDSLSSSDNQLTIEDLSRLRFMEACIKEALRLFPSVPIIGRQVEEDIHIGDLVVPKGCQIYVFTPLIHRDSRHWKDPERFIPDRFMTEGEHEESGKRRHPYAYIPFSAGARNCIGQRFAIMEEKAILAYIFRHFNVTSLDHREQVDPAMALITKTNCKIRVRIESRNKQ